MELEKLYHSKNEVMRVAGLMSGSGENLREIIRYEKEAEGGKCPYSIVVIFSDNKKSNAVQIGKDYGIPVIVEDVGEFYKKRTSRKDLEARKEFDGKIVELLKPFDINVIAYAGYMGIATDVLVDYFLGVNVHPADLSILENGKRKYTGSSAVRDAIVSGERKLKSTTHIVESELDQGKILMLSDSLVVDVPDNFDYENGALVKFVTDAHQKRLKEVGDLVIFPKTLEYIADGRYSKDVDGNLYFDGEKIPNGYIFGS